MRVRGATLVGAMATLLLAAPAAAGEADGGETTGVVFLDLDGDGTLGDNEPGRGDVQVTLRTDAAVVDATTTDNDGRWAFTGVQPGDYDLVVEPPADLAVTGGSLDGISEDGEASVMVTAGDADLGTIGLGSTVASGPDVAATVSLDEDGSTAERFRWEIGAHNLGPDDAPGPVDIRLVLSSGHEAGEILADSWDCERAAAIVLCELDSDVPAGSSLPVLAVTTEATGDVGTTVSVTATARLSGTFDSAPLNDEDDASTTITGEVATEDLDGDGAGDLTDAGAGVTGILLAALATMLAGALALALGAAPRTTRRP